MNDIVKGEYVQDGDTRTVWFVFVCICVVVWQDSPMPEYFNNSSTDQMDRKSCCEFHRAYVTPAVTKFGREPH